MSGAAHPSVLVCDESGRVRYATDLSIARDQKGARVEGASLDDLLTRAPKLREWIGIAAERVVADRAAESCVVIEDDGVAYDVSVVPLAGEGERGYAVVAAPAETTAVDPADVSQRTWHDIKNQLGGLKLYATFLRKKIGETDEALKDTAGKIVAGVDAVVAAIAEARRGEGKTEGDRA
jgi:hypothetical protein